MREKILRWIYTGLVAIAPYAVFWTYKVVDEYVYYQKVKVEVETTQKWLNEPIGNFSDGRVLTRKAFIDLLIVQSGKAQ